MSEMETSVKPNKHYFLLIAWAALLATLYWITGSDWVLIFLAPLAFVILYGSLTGRIMFGAASFIAGHAAKKAIGSWQGSYYSWHNQQIRVIQKANSIWVVEEDLLRAVGMKPSADLRRKLEISYKGYGTIPETSLRGFNESGVIDFLAGKQENNSEVIKLKLWFEREVFFPIKQKRK